MPMRAMDIIYLGHSSFRVQSKVGSLVTDPFDPSMLGIKFPKVSADVITISHDHKDHNQSVLVDDARKVISSPGEYEIGGISIIGIPSFHDDQKGELRGSNLIYVFEVDGYRIVHLGDLGYVLSDSEVSALGDVDILMIPVGGTYTIGPDEAESVVRKIEPSIIIPMHYGSEDLNQEDFSALVSVEEFTKKIGFPVETVNKLTLKDGQPLGEEQKIVLLTRK